MFIERGGEYMASFKDYVKKFEHKPGDTIKLKNLHDNEVVEFQLERFDKNSFTFFADEPVKVKDQVNPRKDFCTLHGWKVVEA